MAIVDDKLVVSVNKTRSSVSDYWSLFMRILGSSTMKVHRQPGRRVLYIPVVMIVCQRGIVHVVIKFKADVKRRNDSN